MVMLKLLLPEEAAALYSGYVCRVFVRQFYSQHLS